jgi:hypothetical protein
MEKSTVVFRRHISSEHFDVCAVFVGVDNAEHARAYTKKQTDITHGQFEYMIQIGLPTETSTEKYTP